MAGLDTRAIELDKLSSQPFPDVKQEFRVFIAEDAFDHAVKRGHEAPTREIGGVMVGEACRDDSGPYVRVESTIDAAHADEQGAELTFTHDTWEYIHKEMDSKHSGKTILGWYHTHPGFGIFLSDRDQFIQRSFFNLPFQIALVYDPKSREHGVFIWKDNEPRRSRRHWVGEREHIWDGTPVQQSAEGPATAMEPAKMSTENTAAAAEPEPFDRFGFVLMGLVLLIAGGLVGWWFGGRSAEAELDEARKLINAQGVVAADQARRSLNMELLGALRSMVGGDAIRAPIDAAVESLDRSLQALEGTNAPENALLEIKAAKRRMETLRDDYTRAEQRLSAFAAASRMGSIDPIKVQRELSQQRAVLGQMCAEVAMTTPDKRAARRLLELAKIIDPGNSPSYEKKIRELEAR